jgi:predicted O-methyltransferase YrrM
MRSSLDDPRVRSTLDRLHADAARDVWRFLWKVPTIVAGLVRGRAMTDILTGDLMRDVYIPVSADVGRFLYLVARTVGARRVVEFGTSFAISTIYLAAGVRDAGGGVVVGTELDDGKQRVATANLAAAGLADVAHVRLGDARETLRDVEAPIDMVFLDGWKDLYLPVLELLGPKLRRGAVVCADNIHTFKTALAPFVAHVRDGAHGFHSVTLGIGSGLEYAVYAGD